MAKSWQEKFDAKPHHDIKVIEKDFWGQKAGDRMLIPSPKMIQAYLDDSESTDLNLVQMRKDLAAANGAEFTCPMTTGIFLRIVAELSLEKMSHSTEGITPFWRVIDPKSDLAKKLSCGSKRIAELKSGDQP